MFPAVSIEISDVTQVATARRAATDMATQLGFDHNDAGRVALLVTEAASNIHKHAGTGELLLTRHDDHWPWLEILALDKGPGFDACRAGEDGYSTSGTMGGGLGAMRRMASSFSVYSRAGQGSVVRLTMRPGNSPAPDAEATSPFEVGAVMLPYPGEEVCGDAWACRMQGNQALLAVADGLGHGIQAHQASVAAVADLPPPHRPPQHLLEHAHGALRGTRGAAMAAAVVDLDTMTVHFAGIGNIGGVLASRMGDKHMVSQAGIVGHNVRKVQPFEYTLEPGALVVLYSDGLATHWRMADYPDLLDEHPAVVAGVLYRDHARGRDDATVMVVRCGAPHADDWAAVGEPFGGRP